MSKKFIVFVLLQVLVLGYIALSHYAVEWYGEEVRLKTAPIDPRDVLYGDYVILNYEISDIAVSKLEGDQKPERGDTIYVLLKKEGDYHQLVSAHLEKPPASSDERVLKGRIDYITHRWDPVQRENSPVESMRVLYGIERYYVPEGAGKELEEKQGQFDVVVKVSPWGQSVSSLQFIANGVMTQWEAEEIVYQHYHKGKSGAITIVRSHLESQYKNQERPVWVIQIMIHEDKTSEKLGKQSVVVIDAKTGEILEEKPKPS